MERKIKDRDGVYYRIKRGGGWMAVCFSDLTCAERDDVLKTADIEYLKKLVNILALILYNFKDC